METSKAIREGHITYKDDNEQVVAGWFIILEQTENYIKFKTHGGNIITISYSRLIKIKERGQNGN